MEIFEGLIKPKTNSSPVVFDLNIIPNIKGVKEINYERWPLASRDDLNLCN